MPHLTTADALQLAAHSGVSHGSVLDALSGRRRPRKATLRALAAAARELGIDLPTHLVPAPASSPVGELGPLHQPGTDGMRL